MNGSIFPWRRLTKLEKCLILELEAKLPLDSAAILRAQVDDIHHAQRLSKSSEVLYYPRKGKEKSPPFAANHAELKFATIRFAVQSVQGTWIADFWLVRGRFFSINFSPSPHPIRSESTVQIKEFRLLHDPAKTVDLTAHMETVRRDQIELPAWVNEIEDQHPVDDLYRPLVPEKRSQFLRELSCSLPDDYLELLECTEGLSIGPVAILGLSQIYEVVVESWTYFLIGELASRGMLGMRAHDDQREIWFLDFGACPPQRMGSSFRDAIRKLLEES